MSLQTFRPATPSDEPHVGNGHHRVDASSHVSDVQLFPGMDEEAPPTMTLKAACDAARKRLEAGQDFVHSHNYSEGTKRYYAMLLGLWASSDLAETPINAINKPEVDNVAKAICPGRKAHSTLTKLYTVLNNALVDVGHNTSFIAPSAPSEPRVHKRQKNTLGALCDRLVRRIDGQIRDNKESGLFGGKEYQISTLKCMRGTMQAWGHSEIADMPVEHLTDKAVQNALMSTWHDVGSQRLSQCIIALNRGLAQAGYDARFSVPASSASHVSLVPDAQRSEGIAQRDVGTDIDAILRRVIEASDAASAAQAQFTDTVADLVTAIASIPDPGDLVPRDEHDKALGHIAALKKQLAAIRSAITLETDDVA